MANHQHRQHLVDAAHRTLEREYNMSDDSIAWANRTLDKYECTVGGCDRARAARGMCMAHYGRWARGVSVSGPIGDKPGRQPGLAPRLSTRR